MNSKNTVMGMAMPIKHKSMLRTYERILRGIHYRHEFARRNPRVVKESCKVLKLLGVNPDSVPAYFVPGGGTLVDVIALAYRKSLHASKSGETRAKLGNFFRRYGVLPVAQLGKPFFGDTLRLNKEN